MTSVDLRVEYYQDEDTGHWGFVVPGLNIVGGGAETHEEAEEEAREAILFTLEGDDAEPVPAGHDVGYFHITVEKAS
jgi:predicted RNase H-like HicB family nuclease